MNSRKKITDLKRTLEELKPVLEEVYKVREIGYFGSFAKGNFTDQSDVDILVELKEPLGWKFFELKDFLEDKLGRPVDLVTQQALKDRLRHSILNETVYV